MLIALWTSLRPPGGSGEGASGSPESDFTLQKLTFQMVGLSGNN